MATRISTVLRLVSILTAALCQDFTTDPANRTVVEGGRVRLACGSPYATSGTCHASYTLSWISRPVGANPAVRVSDCGTVYAPFRERSVTTGVDSVYYYLDIPDVQLMDSGQYWCQLYFGPGSVYNRVSAIAWLTVDQLAPTVSPSCEVRPQQPTIGTEVSLACTLDGNGPVSTLTWYEVKSGSEQLAISSRETEPGQTYTIRRVLLPTDNTREFTCTAGPRTNGPSCSLTPLQIQPLARVTPPFLTVVERETAVFTCSLEAVPPATPEQFAWLVHLDGSWVDVEPDSPNHRFEMTSGGQILEILDVTVEIYDKARVRCLAFLLGDQYQSVNDSFMTVSPPQPATDPYDNASRGPQTGGIVGGALAVAATLVSIALLVIYGIKRRRHLEKATGNQMEMSGKTDQMCSGTSEPGDSPAYEQILLNNENPPEPQSGTATVDNLADTEGVTYTLPGRTESGRIPRYKVALSTAKEASESPEVNAQTAGQPEDNGLEGTYATPHEDEDTPTADAPGFGGPSEGVAATEGAATDDAQTVATEGALYADLDVEESSISDREAATSEEIVYAEIHKYEL